MGDAAQASRNRARYSGQRCCGRLMTTTANSGNDFNARKADSPKSWSRVRRQRYPSAKAAATSSPLDSVFHQARRATVSHVMPRARKIAARCTSIFASSSHMDGIGNLGGDLEDLGQRFPRESPVKGFVDVLQS